MEYNRKVGKYGEDLAAQYLIKKGYQIVNQNEQISHLEIDIIAKIKDKLVFIEVKTRTSNSFGQADEGFSQRKLQLLKKALTEYIDIHSLDPENVRLDLIAIDIQKQEKIAKIKHYRDLF